MNITVGSEETRLLGITCKCFSRNPAQVNDLNGVASSTSVWHKFSIPWLLRVESKSLGNACPSLKLKNLIHSCSRMCPFIFNCALLQVSKKTI